MKIKKKRKGTKARVQAYKKRLSYISTAITVAILIVITAISSFFIYSHLNSSPNQTSSQPSKPKAAIVDHLSLTCPNETFIEKATNTLTTAGYTVDYYPGEEVTVELYRNLPTHGYSLIVLRVHFGFVWESGDMGLFTSEPYSTTKHVYEQLTDQVQIAVITMGGPKYFGITARFIRHSMKGKFNNATIIMMGCNGLTHTSMASEFIEKGAKVYISWNEAVQASHTDQATIHLLQHLTIEKQTIRQAVAETMKEVGPDPSDDSILLYYPPEAGDQTIEDNTANPKTKP